MNVYQIIGLALMYLAVGGLFWLLLDKGSRMFEKMPLNKWLLTKRRSASTPDWWYIFHIDALLIMLWLPVIVMAICRRLTRKL